MTRLYRFALATVLTTLALIAVGGLARLLPAGVGCGNDWPRCNGSWLPPLASAPRTDYRRLGIARSVTCITPGSPVHAIRTSDTPRTVRVFALSGLAAIVLQSAFGAMAALWGTPAGIALLHLTAAMLFLAGAVATLSAAAAARGAPGWLAQLGQAPSPRADRVFALAATLAAALALLLVLFGASTSASGVFACATWPLCGEGTPVSADQTIVHLGYRATALLGALATAGTALFAWRRGAATMARTLTAAALFLVVVQSALNAVAALTGDPAWLSAPHLVVAALVWITLLGAALAAWGPRPERVMATMDLPDSDVSQTTGAFSLPSVIPHALAATLALTAANPALGLDLSLAPRLRARRTMGDYVALTKPGIMTLLLTTTLCAMLMAQRGLPPFWLVAITLLGGILASGGANVLNCYLDRDIDAQMSRTRNRAIAAGRISPDAALAFGISLTIAAVLILAIAVNWTAAMLALAGNLFYVFIYTRWLKRSTPYNIVIGGAAGAVPPLVGWAAVTGDLSPLAWGLFAIVFAWTPPHFWALALLKQGEYTRAAVPMLPVVSGERETRRQIVIYTIVLGLVCVALVPFGLGGIYLASALVLNGVFLGYAIWLYRRPSKRIARQMFFYSLWYLAFIFAAAVVDRIVIT
jgi:protoheme IX farnesyltransferase